MEFYDPLESNCPWCGCPMYQNRQPEIEKSYPLMSGPGPVQREVPREEGGESKRYWPQPLILQQLMKEKNQENDQEKDLPPFYEQEFDGERDWERVKELFPEAARTVMPYVEEECDKLEYEGSPMFDEYPDKRTLSHVTSGIYDQVRQKYEAAEGKDQDETLAMNVETYRRYPPRQNWLSDLIDVLFYEEIFRRRCRRRKCRKY